MSVSCGQTVKFIRVMEEDPLLVRLAESLLFLELDDRIHLAGGVRMSVIRSDQQAMITRVTENLRHVVVCLAGHEDIEFTEHVFG